MHRPERRPRGRRPCKQASNGKGPPSITDRAQQRPSRRGGRCCRRGRVRGRSGADVRSANGMNDATQTLAAFRQHFRPNSRPGLNPQSQPDHARAVLSCLRSLCLSSMLLCAEFPGFLVSLAKALTAWAVPFSSIDQPRNLLCPSPY